MKRALFQILLMLGSSSVLQAQILVIDNQTSCNIDVNAVFADIAGACAPTYLYTPGMPPTFPITIPASGVHSFDISTTTAADWTPGWPGAFPTGGEEWYQVEICDGCSPNNCVTVADPCVAGPPQSTQIIMSCGPCNGDVYTVTYNVLGGGNVLITIN